VIIIVNRKILLQCNNGSSSTSNKTVVCVIMLPYIVFPAFCNVVEVMSVLIIINHAEIPIKGTIRSVEGFSPR